MKKRHLKNLGPTNIDPTRTVNATLCVFEFLFDSLTWPNSQPPTAPQNGWGLFSAARLFWRSQTTRGAYHNAGSEVGKAVDSMEAATAIHGVNIQFLGCSSGL